MLIACTVLCLLWIAVGTDSHLRLYGQMEKGMVPASVQTFKELLEESNWDRLKNVFADDSYLVLKNYFADNTSIKIITSHLNNLTYKAKFAKMGEIGVITFELDKGKFENAKIKNRISPLYFIEKFKVYKVDNLQINVGDARITLQKGYFYETIPFHSLLLFKGKWTFHIRPNDREERLTLERKYRRDYFQQTSQTGVFILTEKEFLKKLPPKGEVQTLEKDLQQLYLMYRDAYGIEIKQFNEYWYLPFPDETNLVVFKAEKAKSAFFYYSHNPNLVPDTQMAMAGTNQLILSYNFIKGLKFAFGGGTQTKGITLSLFLNPLKHYLSGTATVSFANSSTFRVLQLAPGLKLVGNLDTTAKGMNVFRKKNKYYLMGSESKTLSLYYNGTIQPGQGNFELFGRNGSTPRRGSSSKKKGDLFYFLSRTRDYYPNPGSEFFKTDVTVTLPPGLNCLVTGSLVSKEEHDAAVYRFTSEASKGVSMVVGEFRQVKKLDSKTPIHVYMPNSLKLPKSLDLQEVKQAADLFTDTFGPIDMKSINLLIKRGEKEGGVSNNGFVVVNLPPDKKRGGSNVEMNPIPRIEAKILSPILLRDRTEDHILHELAHQWWGGLISWKTYQDNWITEGLAHFSVLYYLKKNKSEKLFNRLVRKLKRWVMRHSNTGPVIYGNRINLLENDYEAFQSVVYNKSALMFLMLIDMIGEDAFFKRLRALVEEYKYKSLSSSMFIRKFCEQDKMLEKFFRKWIYTRAIPQVELNLLDDHKDYDTEEFKQVVLLVKQIGEDADTDFIFPLRLKVTTDAGVEEEAVLIKGPQQQFTIKRDATIRSIDIIDSVTPVREKRAPQPPPYLNNKNQ